MNEQRARAIDVAIRVIDGMIRRVSEEDTATLILARRRLEEILSEGFVPCEKCGHTPAPFAVLDGSDGWCAVCHCGDGRAYGESLDDVREEWNRGVLRAGTVRIKGGTEAFDHHQKKPWWWEEPGHRKGPWVMFDMG